MSYEVVGDWGTSHLRLYRIDDGAVTDRCEGPGVAMLTCLPAATLEAVLEPWRAAGEPDRVRRCGMVPGWLDGSAVCQMSGGCGGMA